MAALFTYDINLSRDSSAEAVTGPEFLYRAATAARVVHRTTSKTRRGSCDG